MPSQKYPLEKAGAYVGHIVDVAGRRRKVRLTENGDDYRDEFRNGWNGKTGALMGLSTTVVNGSPGERLSILSLRFKKNETFVYAHWFTHKAVLLKNNRTRVTVRLRESTKYWIDEKGQRYNKTDLWPFNASGPRDWRIERGTIEFIEENERHNTIFY